MGKVELESDSDFWYIYILFLIFLVLKFTGFIDWAWIWVFAPLWIPLVLFIIGMIFYCIFIKYDKGRD